jgi:hypothetical protein
MHCFSNCDFVVFLEYLRPQYLTIMNIVGDVVAHWQQNSLECLAKFQANSI